ncbi:hypothetical protein NQ315_000667 [Exocentrus adspersus]|uniref:Uncharacterized protein n=1 Tax=Exocentrus adspersus TaxID=1586481 RepID=A0AAV8VNI5_9CUCU|nr:hypothetical protein NQ315_000667 [Exocentrus adspersus]
MYIGIPTRRDIIVKIFGLVHHIHATDEGKNQKPKGKAFYIGLAFVELGSQKKEIGNTSVQNIIRVPGVTGNIDK